MAGGDRQFQTFHLLHVCSGCDHYSTAPSRWEAIKNLVIRYICFLHGSPWVFCVISMVVMLSLASIEGMWLPMYHRAQMGCPRGAILDSNAN